MLTIPHEIISSLNISPRQALQWVKESFRIKDEEPVFLPHKTSIAFEEGKFMNTMPCIVPGLNAMGVKIVTRYPERPKTINGKYSFTIITPESFWLLWTPFGSQTPVPEQ